MWPQHSQISQGLSHKTFLIQTSEEESQQQRFKGLFHDLTDVYSLPGITQCFVFVSKNPIFPQITVACALNIHNVIKKDISKWKLLLDNCLHLRFVFLCLRAVKVSCELCSNVGNTNVVMVLTLYNPVFIFRTSTWI